MSSDLPLQPILQQRRARPVPPEELEMLGKKAAACWSGGEYCNLTSAVTGVVKRASSPLAPEQVRRVVEFANNDAYLKEFRKEGGAHKIIDFGPDGPANAADVLRDLNDGGGKTAMDSGLSDYRRPPDEKRASSDEDDAALTAAFQVTSPEYPEENPLGDVVRLRDKVAGVYDHVSDQISGLEVAYQDLSGRLYEEVKQASLGGVSLGEVVQAWSAVNEDPVFVKAAFDQFVPRLFKEGVFSTLDEMGESLLKTASPRYVNPEHPLVQDYHDFCDVLTKLAGLREWQEELYQGHNKLSNFLSQCMRKEATIVEQLGKAQRFAQDVLQNTVGLPELPTKVITHYLPTAAAVGAGVYAGKRVLDSPLGSIVAPYESVNPRYAQERAMRQQGMI